MQLLTGSRIGLARECAHWLHSDEWPEDDSDDARFGSAVHAGCATLDPAWEPPDTLTPSEQERARRCVRYVLAWYADRWGLHECGPASYHTEIGYRYSPHTGAARTGKPRGENGYEDVLFEIALTVDAVIDDGATTVIEIKTGKHREAHAWQVRTAALAVGRTAELDDVTTVLLYVDENGVYPVVEHLDALDLAAHAQALRELWTGLPGRTEPVPGPHCTELHCPLRTVCPATQAALARAAPAFPLAEIRNDDEARAVLNALPLARARLDGYAAQLRNYARTNPIPLADDRIYGWHVHVERDVQKLTAERIEAGRRILGDRWDEAAQQTLRATVGGFADVAEVIAREKKAAGGPVTIKGETERIMEELIAAGVMKRNEHERCEVFKREPEKSARRK
jgi:hypothetical protein